MVCGGGRGWGCVWRVCCVAAVCLHDLCRLHRTVTVTTALLALYSLVLLPLLLGRIPQPLVSRTWRLLALVAWVQRLAALMAVERTLR